MVEKLIPFIRIKSFHLLIITLLILIISFPFYEEMKNRINASKLIINMYKSSLESSIYQYKFLPFILSQNQKIVDIATGDLDPVESGYFLQRIKYATNVATVFVQDKSGKAIASSNWDKPDSYIGKNYGFRPYFKGRNGGKTWPVLRGWHHVSHPGLLHFLRVEVGWRHHRHHYYRDQSL